MAQAEWDLLNAEIKQHLVGDRKPPTALLAWFLNAVWRLDLPEADDAICDGAGDKGIDGLVVNGELNEIAIFQSKHRESRGAKQGDKDLRNLVGAASYFQTPQAVDGLLAASPNAELANLIARLDVREGVADGASVTRLVFVTNGLLDRAGRDYVESIQNVTPELEVWDQSRLCAIAARTQAPELRDDQVKLNACAPPTKMKLGTSEIAVAIVPATELVGLDGIDDLTLFDRNVRLSEGRTRINRDLADTIKEPGEHVLFPAYHNGLTLLTHGLAIRGRRLSLDGITVVNGCQSLLTLYENKSLELGDLNLLVKVVEVEPNSQLTEKITFRSNNQNPIDLRDQRSTDNIQRALQTEAAELYPGEFAYAIREGEKPEATQVLTNQEAAQLLMAVYLEEPYNAVRKVRLFDTDYRRIFNRTVDAPRLYLLAQVSDALKDIRTSLRSDLASSFSSVRFTLAYLLGVQLKKTPNGAELLSAPQRWLPEQLGEVRRAIGELLEEIVDSVNFFIQEEAADKGEAFDPKVTFKSQEGVRAVGNAVDRDVRRMLKRQGGDAFLFSVDPVR